MRRISIDTLGLMSSKSGTRFEVARKRSGWMSAPRLLTTCVFFSVLWLWFNIGTSEALIPEDSSAYVQDESLRDILNITLGFEKILVLNLPFRTDRRDAMSLSAAVSNIKLEFVEGVTGESINNKAYPLPEENRKLSAGDIIDLTTFRVVNQNLTTALILEDDVDWDIRVRQTLQRFALASRFLSSNHTSIPLSKLQARRNTETTHTALQIIDTTNLAKKLISLPLSSLPRQSHLTHTSSPPSPYGDPTKWDILWLGHCGTGMPRAAPGQHSQVYDHAVHRTITLTHTNDATPILSKAN
ncbi:uncharacterized protein J4E78_005319 [Alternaria triticimaculans]|uniref:uncharacterized protein n=1 Tax=Alternaria triticimaculans TaxID=297637 RepID=UPI0020C2998B|nr:uncharacterized protein J4E78_005319 [Alternaria triticimaculans]KAI4660615.1 hypothetical protein J4E78_005319 [Alternaria triticimaculans]